LCFEHGLIVRVRRRGVLSARYRRVSFDVIGQALARCVADDGHALVRVARSIARLEALAEGLTGSGVTVAALCAGAVDRAATLTGRATPKWLLPRASGTVARKAL
jgi:short-subunit dehydrogenase